MLAKEVVAAVVPSGDVVFAKWDVLLRLAYTHVAIRCVCGVRVVSLWIWETWCLLSDSAVNNSQLAFRKFHQLLTGSPAIG